MTHGALSTDQIYLIVRDELDPRPSPQDIEDALRLLQHPLLQYVATSPGGGGRPSAHHLADRPGLIASKLQMLARSLQGLDEMHDE